MRLGSVLPVSTRASEYNGEFTLLEEVRNVKVQLMYSMDQQLGLPFALLTVSHRVSK